MASLIPASQIPTITGSFGDIFDTFKRDIVIYKEPVKKIVDTFSSTAPIPFAGYGEDNSSSVTRNYEYIPISGTFPAMITYDDPQEERIVNELAVGVAQGSVRVKVQQNARDFINNGKTEKIVFDEKSFNVDSDYKVQHFLGYELYVYQLKATY